MRKIKLIYVIPTLCVGGAEKHLGILASLLDPNEFEIRVCALTKTGDIGNELEAKGIPVDVIGFRNIYDIISAYNLYRYFKLKAPDIVHTYLFDANFWGGFIARLSSVKIIITSRRDMDIWKEKRHLLAEKLGSSKASSIVTNSIAAQEYVSRQEGMPKDKIKVIYNGFDFSIFERDFDRNSVHKKYCVNENNIKIGVVGTISEKKGQEILLRAIEPIFKEFPNAVLILAGRGPKKDFLINLGKELGISEHLRFPGLVSDVPELLSILDLFILPSLFESLPNAVLEAMAMRLPVICSKVGGLPEIITSNENGILTEPGDKDSIHQAIKKILTDRQLCEIISANAQKTVYEKFKLPDMINAYRNLYLDLVRKKA